MMTRLIKLIAAGMVAAGTLFPLQRCVLLPYRCNRETGMAARELIRSEQYTEFRRAQTFRDQISRLRPCVDRQPQDVRCAMILAAAYRNVGLYGSAAQVYESALRFDRRPELYLNLGQTQAQLGKTREALANLKLACIYNPMYLDDVGIYYNEVKHAVDEYQTHLAKGTSR